MNLLKYVRSLSPTYERKEIVAGLNNIREELAEYTLPISKDVSEAFVNLPLKSELGKRLTRELQRTAKFNDSPVVVLHSALENLEAVIPVLEERIKKAFGFQFVTYKMTYDRANTMRLVETIGFYVRYHRKLLLALVAQEAGQLGKATPQRWSKAEKQWLDEGLTPYVNLFPLMKTPVNDFKSLLTNMSSAEIDEETVDIAVQSIGKAKLDPFKLERNFLPRLNNPFFSFGKALAEYQVKRYQASKEEHQALQLRLQELRELSSNGTLSPKLQRLIEHTESRVEQLDYRIARIEEDNRYDDE